MEAALAKCQNCESPVSGKFCSNCGQSAEVQRITFKETFEHFLSSAFAFEGPFLSTLRGLVLNPGKVYREFIGGMRKKYYKPVAFYILVTAIYLIVRALIDYDPLEGQVEAGVPDDPTTNLQDLSQAGARFMVANINNIMFILVFSIAFVMKLFYRKRYNLAEYTTIGFYITGMYVICGMILMVVGKYTPLRPQFFQLLVLMALIFYSSFSLFQMRRFGSFLKYFLISFLSLVIYILTSFGLSMAIVYLKA